MPKVKITGCNAGATVIPLVHAVQTHLVLGLKNSKDAVDDVFAGRAREFEVEDRERADKFAEALRKAGAMVEVGE
ncbi:MAG: ribosomal protein L7/L12 [Pyrinomonadaceae bacterium MAG19_C2-C3]|nr:ribosomal protein L7/L12 [Pyrinomonadaceae bacterium MAG19_C2-C3]